MLYPEHTGRHFSFLLNMTHQQQLHRAYLNSPLWRAKRVEAFAFHGEKCNRCGSDGGDVHHKTYERTGGAELMTDLEILCRDCHEQHHRLERMERRKLKPKKKSKKRFREMSTLALARYLTPQQRAKLSEAFQIPWGVAYSRIVTNEHRELLAAAMKMTGVDSCWVGKFSGPVRKAGKRGDSALRHSLKVFG